MVVGRGSFIESFPLFGLRPRGLRLALRREARPAPQDPRQRARALVRQAPAAADRPGRLPATRAGSAADLAGRRRDAEIVRSRRRARTAADGRDHRRRDAALPAARRPLPRGRQARGHPPDQLKVGVHALGYVAATTKEAADDFFPGYARAFTAWRRNADGRPSPAPTSTPSAGRRARCSSAAPRRSPRRSFATARRWAGSRDHLSDERRLPSARQAHASDRGGRRGRRTPSARRSRGGVVKAHAERLPHALSGCWNSVSRSPCAAPDPARPPPGPRRIQAAPTASSAPISGPAT